MSAMATHVERVEDEALPLPEPWFVVGMSRAGTQWATKCLNEHSLVAGFGESLFWGRAWVEPGPDGMYNAAQLGQVCDHLRSPANWGTQVGRGPGSFKRIADRDELIALLEAAIDRLEPPVSPGRTFQTLVGAVARAEGKRHAIEKTPHHVNWIGRILDALPDARFVIMVREPYGFMRSYKHQGDRRPEEQRRSFERLYHPAATAFVWRRYMRSAQRAVERAGDRAMIVRFDEIKGNAPETLARIQRFFGLPVEPIEQRVPPDNTSFPGGKKPELSPTDVLWMNLIAGGEMRRSGFERRPAALQPIAFGASVLRVPLWVARNVVAVGRRTSSPLSYFASWFRS